MPGKSQQAPTGGSAGAGKKGEVIDRGLAQDGAKDGIVRITKNSQRKDNAKDTDAPVALPAAAVPLQVPGAVQDAGAQGGGGGGQGSQGGGGAQDQQQDNNFNQRSQEVQKFVTIQEWARKATGVKGNLRMLPISPKDISSNVEFWGLKAQDFWTSEHAAAYNERHYVRRAMRHARQVFLVIRDSTEPIIVFQDIDLSRTPTNAECKITLLRFVERPRAKDVMLAMAQRCIVRDQDAKELYRVVTSPREWERLTAYVKEIDAMKGLDMTLVDVKTLKTAGDVIEGDVLLTDAEADTLRQLAAQTTGSATPMLTVSMVPAKVVTALSAEESKTALTVLSKYSPGSSFPDKFLSAVKLASAMWLKKIPARPCGADVRVFANGDDVEQMATLLRSELKMAQAGEDGAQFPKFHGFAENVVRDGVMPNAWSGNKLGKPDRVSDREPNEAQVKSKVKDNEEVALVCCNRPLQPDTMEKLIECTIVQEFKYRYLEASAKERTALVAVPKGSSAVGLDLSNQKTELYLTVTPLRIHREQYGDDKNNSQQ